MSPWIVYYKHKQHGSVYKEIVAACALDAWSEFERTNPHDDILFIKPKNIKY